MWQITNISQFYRPRFTLHKHLAKIVTGCSVTDSLIYLCIQIYVISNLIVFRLAVHTVLFEIGPWEDMVDIARRFQNVGYRIFATKGTAKVLNDNGVKALEVHKIEQESPNLLDLILGHEIDLVIDIPQQGAERSHDGFVIRRNAIETGVNVLTALDTAAALATSLENRAKELSLIDIATVQ